MIKDHQKYNQFNKIFYNQLSIHKQFRHHQKMNQLVKQIINNKQIIKMNKMIIKRKLRNIKNQRSEYLVFNFNLL